MALPAGPDDMGGRDPDGDVASREVADGAPPARTGIELPEAATRRFSSGAWSSGLSVPDFASCISMGMEPVGFVQGCAVMQWSWYTAARYQSLIGPPAPGGRGQYSETWRCPHGFVGAEHRMFGYNYEQSWLESSWATGFGLAYRRMVEEAASLGAHGVVGVVDDMQNLARTSAVEFKIRGTAVVVPGAKRPDPPFTTYLSGQRLAKLLEAGFAPVAVTAALSSVQMIGYCITNYQLAGSSTGAWSGVAGVNSIAQVGKAQRAARHLAREHIRAQLGSDVLHGASLEQFEKEVGEGDMNIQCIIRGTRVRRFKDFDPLPEPQPVVRLV
jgi:Putative heavy-metal-binding